MGTTLGHKSRIYYAGYGYSKRRCETVTSWFLKKFLPRHNIGVTVIHRGLVADHSWGFCDFVGTSYNPRDFEIEIQSNLRPDDYIKTLLHELVHLRQWVRGTLTMKSGKMHFKDKSVSEFEYMKQPHEIEAYAEEIKLYQLYMEEVHGMPVKKPTPSFTNRLCEAL
jgi:hypothetical protein|tara:strand:- start:140 stop:637 length:498 start_codon:yes stop_codon:yes gene_type:complete